MVQEAKNEIIHYKTHKKNLTWRSNIEISKLYTPKLKPGDVELSTKSLMEKENCFQNSKNGKEFN